LLIRRGLDALARAEALGGGGPYVLQAALAACHARARRAADTDWPRIAALYDRLRVVAPSPVIDLNRAIAHSMAFGPEAGLRLLDEIAGAAALRDYAPLPAARGDFLFRAGRLAEARSEFTAAATISRNARERAFLLARADACDGKPRLLFWDRAPPVNIRPPFPRTPSGSRPRKHRGLRRTLCHRSGDRSTNRCNAASLETCSFTW
jgi:predicted RNA polymerase sigma factor